MKKSERLFRDALVNSKFEDIHLRGVKMPRKKIVQLRENNLAGMSCT